MLLYWIEIDCTLCCYISSLILFYEKAGLGLTLGISSAYVICTQFGLSTAGFFLLKNLNLVIPTICTFHFTVKFDRSLSLLQKVSVRERHSSGNRRGNYNHDRNDSSSDREGNWNANSKPRAAARNHSRGQTDKSNSRADRSTHSDGRADHLWNSYRHNSNLSYPSQNGPLRSNSSQNGPQNVAYSMYPFTAVNQNGVSNGPAGPPIMMLYPFDHNATYGSHSEQFEFGSVGPIGFPGINEHSHLNDGPRARAFEDHRLHGSTTHHSSPDQPSSPHHQR